MKVLVTGAAGFIGRHIIDYLSKHGYEPIGTDLANSSHNGSVTDKTFVLEGLSQLDFEAIVHLAGMVDLKKSLENPYHCYEVNCFGTLNMLELGLKKNVKRFVFGSSANVYGAPKSLPAVEDSPYNPRAPYDYSKVIGETLAMSYYRNKMLPVSITRSWLIFGENDAPNRAIPRFINACLKNEPIQLFNAGRDTTAPSHVMNYAKLVKLILDDKVAVGEAFNFGGERVLSIRELAELIKRITGSRSELIMLPSRMQLEAEPQVSYPSTDKIRKKLGYIYESNLEEGLKRTIQSTKLTS